MSPANPHRNADAKRFYLSCSKSSRLDYVNTAQCDQSAIGGYLRDLAAVNQNALVRIRTDKGRNRAEVLDRKARFLHTLARMVKRRMSTNWLHLP